MSTVERPEDGRRELRWTIVGVLIALGAGVAGFGMVRWVFPAATPAGVRFVIYSNAEWLGIVALLAGGLLFGLFVRLPERPWRGAPPSARAWECLLFGLGMGTVPLAGAGLVAFGVITLIVVLPIRLSRDHILAPGASLTGILTVIPVAFLALGLTATVLHMLMIGFKKGALVSAEGKLLEGPHEGGTGQGTMDLVNVYFFSCFAVLGGDFAEYRPTGGCRVVTLGSVILGRVLEVVVIAAGINLLVLR
jgi:hypothetical protein